MRDDLPKGLLAAQVTHAAGESSPGNLPQGTYAVVLAAKGAEHLRAIAARLTLGGVKHWLIKESDHPYSGEEMAIGIAPAPRSEVYRCVSSLPLLK